MARHKLTPRRVITKKRRNSALSRASPAVLTPTVVPATQVFESPDGVRGEVLRLGCANHIFGSAEASNRTHILFLPGNPGVIEYYRPTLRSLWRRFPEDVREQVSLHALGYPGHDLRQLNGLRMFNIADHVKYIQSYVSDMTPALPEARLMVIGHSYGCYAAVRVAENLGDAVDRVSLVMLMPALWQMGACAGWLPRQLLKDTYKMTSWLTWGLTAFLPPFLRDALIAAQGHRRDLDDVTRMMVDGRQRGLFLNICALARDEVVKILEPGDTPVVSRLGGRSLLVYVDVDKWCPPEGRRRVQKAFGDDLTVEHAGENVSHGFCLFEDETEKVVKAAAPWVCERIRGNV